MFEQHPLLAPPGWFLGVVYEAFVRARNRMYDGGLLHQQRLPHPVISIGNLTMGGSGKTPLVIHLAEIISRAGATPVLLSRGYGRNAKHDAVVEPQQDASAADQVGDEPALARRRVPPLWLGISANRHAVGLSISARCAHAVFILDDGYQHRRLARDLNILVIDRSQPLSSNRVVPRGTLREPLRGASRADIVVINGRCDSAGFDQIEQCVRKHVKPGAATFHCTQEIESLAPLASWRDRRQQGCPAAMAAPAFLVAAVGNPERFRRDILALGVEIKGTRFFRDHFALRSDHWLSCVSEARACGAGALITTEKDAIKLTGEIDFPLLVAVQSTRLKEQSELETRIGMLIEGYH